MRRATFLRAAAAEHRPARRGLPRQLPIGALPSPCSVRTVYSRSLHRAQQAVPLVTCHDGSFGHCWQRRCFSSNKPETLEEMAKRLSDEAEAEFQASGRPSSVRTKRPQQPQQPHQPAPDSAPSPPAADSGSTSTESASPDSSSTNSSGPSSPSSSSSSPSILSILSREWRHLQEYFKKFQRPAPAISRSKRGAKEVLSQPTIVPKKKEPATAAAAATAPAEAAEADAAAVADPTAPPPPSALVLVDSDTVWDKRLERMRRSFESSSSFLRFRKAQRTLIHKSNPILRPIVDTWDDIKLTWETSQHPTLFRVRDVVERVVGETEMGFAIGEIMKQDPSFDVVSFTAEMEEYMIPVVITAYLRGSPSDQRLLAQCAEGFAATIMRASFQERLAQGEEWDNRILDISHVELQKAVMLKQLPVLQVGFMVQQVNCVRKIKGWTAAKPNTTAESKDATGSEARQTMAAERAADGQAAAVSGDGEVKQKRFDREGREIVLGSESDITSIYYHWVLRRDFENPDFDWKLMEMTHHKIFSLVG